MIERKIIIGLITSTEYCQKVKDIFNVRLLDSSTAKRIATWVWEYFGKYNKAPGRDIEPIFYSKVKEHKFPKDLAEEIEQDILPSLSEEYEKEPTNLEYLVVETEKYLNEQHIKLFTENIQGMITAGKLEDAEKLVHLFKPLGIASNKLEPFIRSVQQIRRNERTRPKTFIKNWLKEGQLTIIYADYGIGKSLLTILVGYVLGVRDYTEKECEIGEWQVKRQTGCLYIDGELGELEMEERIKQFEWLGQQPPEYRMKVLSIPEYQLATEDSFYLSERTNQLHIIKWLRENPTYKLVVLDSASTLFGLQEENDNSEWNNKINPLLRDLRALGVACILLHHSGKNGRKGLRGASAMGAMAHNIFRLEKAPDKNETDGVAWFNLWVDKQRAAGYSFKPFSIEFSRENGEEETHWEVSRTVN